MVLDVAASTPAARLGLRRGDIIASVNELKILQVDGLEDALGAGPGVWRLAVQRGDRVFNVTVQG